MAILFPMVAMPYIPLPNNKGILTLSFQHFVDSRLLQLDTVIYNNALGQAFTITKFKYYIGNIQLRQQNKEMISIGGYYLVDEEEQLSKTMQIDKIPVGAYTGIDFIVGVDSLDNCSGAQAGALDPVNAMFWAWNTGYIFLKLEGKSPVSKSPGTIFEFHIGGYKPPANCIRKIHLDFVQPILIKNAGIATINIKTDIAEILKTPTTIDFSKLSSVTDFHNATTIADNYTDMFSIFATQ